MRTRRLIESIKCIKNLGPFERVECVKLGNVTLVHGENGRGKTMLSEMFRSLATNAPELVQGRTRLGSNADPVVVLETADGETVSWNKDRWRTKGELPKVSVFNDGFVDANVYSGLDVSSAQRQRLHSVVVGEEGVAKTKAYEEAVINATNRLGDLTCLKKKIKAAVPDVPDVDAFWREETPQDIDQKIEKNANDIYTAKRAEQIGERGPLSKLELPSLPVPEVRELLGRGISGVTSEAASRVRSHLDCLWDGGEPWVHEGWRHSKKTDNCPYCGQSLSGVQLVTDFADHFEGAYARFKKEIEEFQAKFKAENNETQRRGLIDQAAEIEKLQRDWARDGLEGERLDFRAKDIADLWQTFADGVSSALAEKSGAPLESRGLDEQTENALVAFEAVCKDIESENRRVREMNLEITRLKDSVITANMDKLKEEKANLGRLKRRGESDVVELCRRYERAGERHRCAEKTRNQKRVEMESYNEEIFRRYGNAINGYLYKFGTGFRIEGFKEEKPGGKVTSSFVISINRAQVPVRSENPEASQPSFRNTLSAGDRNALALAFFFSSLDSMMDQDESIVVIDDPLSSLDAARRLNTIGRIFECVTDSWQVVVMSHDVDFLCTLDRRIRDRRIVSGLSVDSDDSSSVINDWDLIAARRSETQKRGARMQGFVDRKVKRCEVDRTDIRFQLDDWLALSFPSQYNQGSTSPVGEFLGKLESDDSGTVLHLLDRTRAKELRELHDFSNDLAHPNLGLGLSDDDFRVYFSRTLDFCRGN